MSALKTIGAILGKKGILAAKIAVVTIGAGAATTGVVLLNDEFNASSSESHQITEQLIQAPQFDKEKAELLLNLNDLFENPIEIDEEDVEYSPQVAYVPVAQEVVIEEAVPEVTANLELVQSPKVAIPEMEIAQEEVQLGHLFTSADMDYFNKYGLERAISPAKFNGGERKLRKYVAEQLEYPSEAYKEGVEGLVEVAFMVDSDGSISDIEIVNGSHPSLNEEALRVVESFPNWEPRKVNSEPVKSYVSIPIRFEIQ